MVVWLAMSIFAMLFWYESRMGFSYSSYDERVDQQVLGTLVVYLLLALVPVGAATREVIHWESTARDDRVDQRRPMPTVVVAMIAALMIFPLQLMTPKKEIMEGIVPSAVALWLGVMTLSMFSRFVATVSSRTTLFAILWLVVAWIGPFFADLIFQAALGARTGLGAISTLSPLGVIAVSWGDLEQPENVWAGLAIQAVVLVFWWVMAWRFRKPPVRLADRPLPGSM
ncbi:MAG TPA: hypothetical protein VMD30_03000 [Tepidisphaeraceae bacterium]|nr:hypothetical protein [Tepidisphaeraceae bacterium]